jgi:hypothetical protein
LTAVHYKWKAGETQDSAEAVIEFYAIVYIEASNINYGQNFFLSGL